MALVAALAAALAAFGIAVVAGGYRVGPLSVPPVAYGLALLPGVLAVAVGRRPPAREAGRFTIPPSTTRLLSFGVGGIVFLAMSVKEVPDDVGLAVTSVAASAVVITTNWWPLPLFLRASVALAALGLVRPGVEPGTHVGTLLLSAAAAAVALVAATRLDAASIRALGDRRWPARGRRVAVEAGFVVLALVLGAVLASRLNDRQPRQQESRTGADPREGQPAPLAFQDALDPNQGGLGHRGGDPDQVVLKVATDRPAVLRAVTFDEWDGRSWRRSPALVGDRVFDDRGGVPVADEGLGGFPGRLSRQRIRVEAPYASVAVGTPRVFYYDLPVGGRPYPDGTVELVPAVGKGTVYAAQTGRSDASADDLRATTATAPLDIAIRPFGDRRVDQGSVNPAFTAEPELSDRARALAERLTAGATTDYDKVAALSTYLDDSVALDDDVAALAAGTDTVDSVLFGGAPSSPERLATTLALMTRSIGLPTRLATGFLPGKRPFFGGDFVVRAGDVHAWVEVPFAGIGWQRFDPSGRIERAEAQDSLWSRLRRAWERYWPLFVSALVVLVALVARRLVAWRRRLAATPWATRYFGRLVRVGARRGRPRRPSETPAEYTSALAGGVLADERLVEVGRVVTAAAWSGREPSETTRAWAEQVLAEATRATRSRRFRPRARGGVRSTS